MNIEYYTVMVVDNESHIDEYNFDNLFQAQAKYNKMKEFGAGDTSLIHNFISDRGSMSFSIVSFNAETGTEFFY